MRGRDVKDEDEEYCEILVSQDKIQSSDSLRPNNYMCPKKFKGLIQLYMSDYFGDKACEIFPKFSDIMNNSEEFVSCL